METFGEVSPMDEDCFHLEQMREEQTKKYAWKNIHVFPNYGFAKLDYILNDIRLGHSRITLRF